MEESLAPDFSPKLEHSISSLSCIRATIGPVRSSSACIGGHVFWSSVLEFRVSGLDRILWRRDLV